MLRLLLDECLSPTLVARAQARGVDATHVRFLGKAGYQDYNLIDIILAGEYCFVTNNARDFLKLFAEVEWHDGLVIILPQTRLAEQIVLFEAALDFVGGLDHTINRVVEVHSATDIRLSNLPPDELR
ncbi:DUF5615 family PIN-like protein [Magnetospirillum moscoviense]|uniref:DUF5615 domain-containing protein n=1 Tax=Magnetospirillum moscoviense TaxID=1437059 RepID=A0A178MJH9_9PROT|nr:DUF5615 family PIN-like protein [Magnetospirillum moscoviense]MBF0324645.1 DUF5615 family PIN-like protein [Alphaproteobacteria bacterium]OAN48891.1 hypothetical protein A6A05_02585 [Magnetospirillum moscoviense]